MRRLEDFRKDLRVERFDGRSPLHVHAERIRLPTLETM
jgi:hypothetical protein